MKNIALISLLTVLTLFPAVFFAQQIYFEKGTNMTTFLYTDSQGVALENLHETKQDVMAVGYRSRFFNNNLHGFIGLAYAGYGTVGSLDNVAGVLRWQTSFAELNLGIDINLFAIRKLQFYARPLLSTGILVRGYQELNGRVINLNNNDVFKNPMLDFRIGGGFILPASESISFYAHYLAGKSFNQYGDVQSESLRIRSHVLSFGVLISVARRSVKSEAEVETQDEPLEKTQK